jgi:hypothetical protein
MYKWRIWKDLEENDGGADTKREEGVCGLVTPCCKQRRFNPVTKLPPSPYILSCGHIVPCWRQSQMKGVSCMELPLRKTWSHLVLAASWISGCYCARSSAGLPGSLSRIPRRADVTVVIPLDVPPSTKLQNVTLLLQDVIIRDKFQWKGSHVSFAGCFSDWNWSSFFSETSPPPPLTDPPAIKLWNSTNRVTSYKDNVFWDITWCSPVKFTEVSEEPAASIFRFLTGQ